MVLFGQKMLFLVKLLYSGKSGSNWEKSGCFRAKVVVFGPKWLCSGKVVPFGQSGFNRAQVVVLGQNGSIWAKVVVLGQGRCNREKQVFFG